MKVFAVEKIAKGDLQVKNTRENKSFIKIEEDSEFNFITIQNPTESNRICILEDIDFKLGDKDNMISLMIGEMNYNKTLFRATNTFNVNYELKKDRDRNLEICSMRMYKDESKNVLKDFLFFLLPKGCIFVKLDKSVKDLEFTIKWREEAIFQ